jgi:hypothetical protein
MERPAWMHTALSRLKQAALRQDVELQPHQEEAADTLQQHPKQLYYMGLGSGKSLAGIAGAEQAHEPYTAIVPAALRGNFRKEIDKFTDDELSSDVMSHEALALGKQPQHTGTVIVDEAHRLRTEDALRTKAVQDVARRANRLALLSGSPIVNRPSDLAPLISMLTDKPLSTKEFDEQFVGKQKVRPGLWNSWWHGIKPGEVEGPKNVDKLKELLKDKVQYYAPSTPMVDVETKDVNVPMSPQQQQLYQHMWGRLPWTTRWKLQKDFPLSQGEARSLTSFLSGPRQVGLSTLPFMRGNRDVLKAFDQSTKLQAAMKSLQTSLNDPAQKAVVFSNFIDAGLNPYAAGLERAKIPYSTFHGGLDDRAKKKSVDDYNSGASRVMLLGPAGAEGISLKGTRLLQLLDSYWNAARIQQAIGRGVRFDSHTDLPEDQRKVMVEKYYAKLPERKGLMGRAWDSLLGAKDVPPKYENGPDDYLDAMSRRKEELNEKFRAILRDVGQMKAANLSAYLNC